MPGGVPGGAGTWWPIRRVAVGRGHLQPLRPPGGSGGPPIASDAEKIIQVCARNSAGDRPAIGKRQTGGKLDQHHGRTLPPGG